MKDFTTPMVSPDADLISQMRDIIRDELRQQKLAELSEKLLTPKETAAMFSVSIVTLWKWEKQGRIVKYYIGGRTYFKHGELMASMGAIKRYQKPNMVRRASAS